MGKSKLLDKLLEKSSKTSLGEESVQNIERESSLTLEDIKDRIQDREERKKYARHTFFFLVAFTFTVLGIVIAVGLENWICFRLSDTVVITLITTSLASIVGIFAIVMRYLFKQSNNNS